MEPNEILKRIKLMMNYDSKKTLTENKILFEDNGQQPNADVMAIYNTLKSAVYDMGTDIAKLNQAFDLISKSTDNSNLISLDNYMAKKPIYGGFNSFYRFLQELLNGELGLRNFKDAERYRDILNRIPGITASFEKGRRSEDMKSDSFRINFKKPATQQQNNTSNNSAKYNKKFGACITSKINDTKFKAQPISSDAKEDGYACDGVMLTFGNKVQFFCADPAFFYDKDGDYYAKYECKDNKIVATTTQTKSLTQLLGITASNAGATNQINSQASNPNQQTVSNIGNTEQDLEAGKVIARGSRGDFVKQIQLKLFNAAEGWANEFIQSVKNKPGKTPLDGIFGRVTQSVVKQYQQNNQITPANGQVNKATWEKLKNVAVTTTYNPETKKTANVSSEIETLPSKKIGISSDTESLPSQSPSSNTPSSPSQQASTDDTLPT